MKRFNLFLIIVLLGLNTQGNFAQTKVLMEKMTASWCGWCPENDLELDAILEQYGEENFIVVHHHIMDAMSIEFGEQIAQEFVNGTPSLLLNRFKFEDQWNVGVTRTEWTAHAPQALAMLQNRVDIASNHTYNAQERSLSINIDLSFLTNLNGDYRVNCYIVEDKVSSPEIDFAQSNYWSGEDHELGNQPNPIVGFEHLKVVREILGGPWGLPGVLNANISAGEEVNTIFFYNVPEYIDHEKLSYVVLVQEYNDDKFQREIVNALEEKVSFDIAADIESIKNNITIFPNPVSDFLNVQTTSVIEGLRVFNARGQELFLKHDSHGVDVSDLAIGWYILQLQTAEGTIHHKFIKE